MEEKREIEGRGEVSGEEEGIAGARKGRRREKGQVLILRTNVKKCGFDLRLTQLPSIYSQILSQHYTVSHWLKPQKDRQLFFPGSFRGLFILQYLKTAMQTSET